MGKLLLIILVSIVIIGVLYRIIHKLLPVEDSRAPLSKIQLLLCWFVVLYTPIQLMVLLAAGQYMPLLNTKEHTVFAGLFTTSHALLAVMGISMSMFFYRRNKSAMTLMVLNAATAIFYTMSAIIFFMAM